MTHGGHCHQVCLHKCFLHQQSSAMCIAKYNVHSNKKSTMYNVHSTKLILIFKNGLLGFSPLALIASQASHKLDYHLLLWSPFQGVPGFSPLVLVAPQH